MYLNFKSKVVENQDFSGKNLSYSLFRDATLKNCNFDNAILHYCNFRDAKFEGCSFNGAKAKYSVGLADQPGIDMITEPEEKEVTPLDLKPKFNKKKSRK